MHFLDSMDTVVPVAIGVLGVVAAVIRARSDKRLRKQLEELICAMERDIDSVE